MTIQRRLALSFSLVLVLSLAIGLGLTYSHVLSKVRTETQAALNVGADSARHSLDVPGPVADPAEVLRGIVADFDGDRHLRARVEAPDGAVLAQSRPLAPDEAAPGWFYDLVHAAPERLELPLPPALAGVGRLILQTDSHNEVAEAWSDTRLTLTILAFFFAMVLVLAFATVKAGLAPLREIGQALNRIGSGDYSTRLAAPVAAELEPLRDGFNRMASRLEEMGHQNRALNEQILNLQEEERAELARDLHDDVAPFLFSVGADAAMIRQFLAKGESDAVGPRAEAIAEAVRHMQHHLKDVLRRLAPGALLDLGLPGAIDNLVAFWRSRQPGIAFEIEVAGDPIDPPLDAVAFRVVQESFSNAIRHGAPTTIEVTIDADDEQATIVVEDDGKGFSGPAPTFGFGLTGMQERVRAVGGTLRVANRASGRGARVEARLPIRQRRPTEPSQSLEMPA
jgi:two-component system, NarL family, sensor histidine kinase UhpB